MMKPIRVVICGTGNGSHALAGVIASQADTEVCVLTRSLETVERWTQTREVQPLNVIFKDKAGDRPPLSTQAFSITHDPEVAAKNCDLVLLGLPAFGHLPYLTRLGPYLEPGCTIVGLPGQSAFEIDVNQALGSKLQQCVVINLETFPW
ncbi:MAG: hypothetical protein F6K41_08710, partial [Symploca sp. SIO3E6]|nr:hypothetical protein [Caldora sp. SIO3E6]